MQSGGEKQRVCIARALAADPDLIICDEVTSALDQLVAEGVLKLLQRLQRELSVSYLFITHDLATVKAIADDIIVMLSGRIVEKGNRNEVLKPPHHKYTELLCRHSAGPASVMIILILNHCLKPLNTALSIRRSRSKP